MILGTVYRPEVAVAAGVDTDLTGEPLRPPVPLNVAVENLPANATDAFTKLEMASFVQSIGGDWFPLTLVPSGPNQRAEISPAMPDIAAIDNVVVTQVRGGSGAQTVETRVAGASDIDEDVGPLLLPSIDSAAYDAATNEVRIVAGDGAPADCGDVNLIVGTGSGSSSFYWNVFTPYETGDIVLPELAGALSEYRATAADTVSVHLNLRRSPGGADAIRPCAFDGSRGCSAALAIGESAVTEQH